jgi:cold shock CspA family protein
VEVAGEPISSLERTFLRGGVLRGKGTRRIGTVKHFNVSRGGVIAPEGGGKEIDLPLTSVRSEGRDELKEGAKVTFRYGIRLSAKEAADVPANVEIEGA